MLNCLAAQQNALRIRQKLNLHNNQTSNTSFGGSSAQSALGQAMNRATTSVRQPTALSNIPPPSSPSTQQSATVLNQPRASHLSSELQPLAPSSSSLTLTSSSLLQNELIKENSALRMTAMSAPSPLLESAWSRQSHAFGNHTAPAHDSQSIDTDNRSRSSAVSDISIGAPPSVLRQSDSLSETEHRYSNPSVLEVSSDSVASNLFNANQIPSEFLFVLQQQQQQQHQQRQQQQQQQQQFQQHLLLKQYQLQHQQQQQHQQQFYQQQHQQQRLQLHELQSGASHSSHYTSSSPSSSSTHSSHHPSAPSAASQIRTSTLDSSSPVEHTTTNQSDRSRYDSILNQSLSPVQRPSASSILASNHSSVFYSSPSLSSLHEPSVNSRSAAIGHVHSNSAADAYPASVYSNLGSNALAGSQSENQYHALQAQRTDQVAIYSSSFDKSSTDNVHDSNDPSYLTMEALCRLESSMFDPHLSLAGDLDPILGQNPQVGQEEVLLTLEQMSEELNLFTGFEEEDLQNSSAHNSSEPLVGATSLTDDDSAKASAIEGASEHESVEDPVDKAALQTLVNAFLNESCNSTVVYELYRIGRQILNQLRRIGRVKLITRESVHARFSTISLTTACYNKRTSLYENDEKDEEDKENIEYMEYILFSRFLRDSIAPRCFQLGPQIFLAAMAAHMYRGHVSRCNVRNKLLNGERLSQSEIAVLSTRLCLGQEHLRPAHENDSFIRPLVTTFQLPQNMNENIMPKRKRMNPIDFSSTGRRQAQIRRRKAKQRKRMQRMKINSETTDSAITCADQSVVNEATDSFDLNMTINERLVPSSNVGQQIAPFDRKHRIKMLASSSSSGCCSGDGTPSNEQSPLMLQLSSSSSAYNDDLPLVNNHAQVHHKKRFGRLAMSESNAFHSEKPTLAKTSFSLALDASQSPGLSNDEKSRTELLPKVSNQNQENVEAINESSDDEDDQQSSCYSEDDESDDESNCTIEERKLSILYSIQRNFDRYSRLRFYSEKEQERIGYINDATRILSTGEIDDMQQYIPDIHLENGPLKLQTYGVFKFIMCFKTLPSFNSFSPMDQKTLLRNCCAQLLLLRSAKHFDKNKMRWEIESAKKQNNGDPDDGKVTLSIDVMKHNRRPNTGLHDLYLEFSSKLDPDWKDDEVLMTILSAIILFASEGASPSATGKQRMEYFVYVNMLRRYLETTRPTYDEARRDYVQILRLVSVLTGLRELYERSSVYLKSSELMMDRLLLKKSIVKSDYFTPEMFSHFDQN